ncbi:hypothetical protein BHE74_00031350 [Ensete ventricosum]|nr:hypothetical protein BHE74_00031350 [Ensete ventricosum]
MGGTNRPLPDDTTDWGYFRPINAQNRLVIKKREKKRENLDIRHYSPDPDPSLAGFSMLRRENLRRSRGEGMTSGLLAESLQGDLFSLLEEKKHLPT